MNYIIIRMVHTKKKSHPATWTRQWKQSRQTLIKTDLTKYQYERSDPKVFSRSLSSSLRNHVIYKDTNLL